MKFNFFYNKLFSEEIAEVKTELEEEGFTPDEAVKLIQQVYRKIGGFENKSKEHSYPVHEKVAGQFNSKLVLLNFQINKSTTNPDFFFNFKVFVLLSFFTVQCAEAGC